ncbi:MAG: hypothetical protein ACRDRS_25260 [Pseudonocardiaceae bacterium]
MDTLSPAVADALELLAADLYEHLGEAEGLACTFADWTNEDIDHARKLIPDLVGVIRGLLIEHEMSSSGACRTCSSPWPCPVVCTIHALVKDPDHAFVALVTRVREGECSTFSHVSSPNR